MAPCETLATNARSRVGCIALRASDGTEDTPSCLVAALARDDDHSGGVICALHLPEDADDAVCTEVVDLPVMPHRFAQRQPHRNLHSER